MAFDQGPHEQSPYRRDARESPQPRPARQVEQHGLRHVVGDVARRYGREPPRLRYLLRKPVPLLARPFLEVSPGQIDAPCLIRDTQVLAQLLDELRVFP